MRPPLFRACGVCLSFLAASLATAEAIAQTTQAESRYSRTAEREIRFQVGTLRYSSGRLKEAEEDFRAIVTEDPADAEAWYFLGLSQLDQGLAAQAVDSLSQSLRLDPTSDEVRAARARANILLRNFGAAREDLAVLEPDPKWRSVVDYLTGQLLYAEGKLDEAARAFANAKRAGSTESAPAGFYEGLTYLRMRQLVRARSTFRESALGADRDFVVAAASRQLDSVLAQQARQLTPWEFQLTLSYEYDSNVILISPDIPLPIAVSNESDGRIVVQPRGSYSLIRNDQLEVGLEGNGYFSFQFDLTDFDVAALQGGPYVNYKLRDNLYASIRYGYNYVEQDYEKLFDRQTVTPQITWLQPRFGYTSSYFQYQYLNFSDPPQTDPLNRDGSIYALGIVQGISLPELFSGAGQTTLELSYRYEYQDTDGSDFDGNFNSFGATFYAPLPVWKLRADCGVSYAYDRYSNDNSLDADGDPRRDDEWNVVVGLTKDLNKNLAFRVDYIYTDNDSNVQNTLGQNPFDYNRYQIGVRLIFTY